MGFFVPGPGEKRQPWTQRPRSPHITQGALAGFFSLLGSHFPHLLLAKEGATLWPPCPPECRLSMAAETDFPSEALVNTFLQTATQASPFPGHQYLIDNPEKLYFVSESGVGWRITAQEPLSLAVTRQNRLAEWALIRLFEGGLKPRGDLWVFLPPGVSPPLPRLTHFPWARFSPSPRMEGPPAQQLSLSGLQPPALLWADGSGRLPWAVTSRRRCVPQGPTLRGVLGRRPSYSGLPFLA